MYMEARMAGKPCLDGGCLVGAVVVQDQMQVELGPNVGLNGTQDCKNSLARWRRCNSPMTLPVATSRCKQAGRAVTLVVMVRRSATPGASGNMGWVRSRA